LKNKNVEKMASILVANKNPTKRPSGRKSESQKYSEM